MLELSISSMDACRNVPVISSMDACRNVPVISSMDACRSVPVISSMDACRNVPVDTGPYTNERVDIRELYLSGLGQLCQVVYGNKKTVPRHVQGGSKLHT
jgi:hypothetical protein